MRSACSVLAATCAALVAVLMLTPQGIGTAFGIRSAEGFDVLVPALRLFTVYLPFNAAVQLLQNFYTTTDRKRIASAIVVMDGLVFVLAYAFLFANAASDLFWLCYACSGAATLLAAAVVSARIQKKSGCTVCCCCDRTAVKFEIEYQRASPKKGITTRASKRRLKITE